MTGTNKRGLYAIFDLLAQDIVQNVVTICRHEAPMVRMFTDLLGGRGPIAEHPADYNLVRVGDVDDDNLVFGHAHQVILTGAQWARLHQQTPETDTPQQPRCEPEANASPPMPQGKR